MPPAFWANDEVGICKSVAAKPMVRNVLLKFIIYYFSIDFLLFLETTVFETAVSETLVSNAKVLRIIEYQIVCSLI